MDKILGLGTAGCNVASLFQQYPQYEIYGIDTSDSLIQNFFQIKKEDEPEGYERNCPDLSDFFKDLSGEVLFIMCGASSISSASLAILEQLKNKCQINVLYIRPNVSSLSETRRLSVKLTFNVFQQYARSGVFKQMYAVDNKVIEDIIDGIPVMEYYNKINQLIVSTIHMINVYNHSNPVAHTFSEPHRTARISTFGIVDAEKKEEKLFFSLDSVREKQYYYAIQTERLKTDEKLYKQITNYVEEQEAKSSYGIYSTGYENDYGYCIARSSTIQKK